MNKKTYEQCMKVNVVEQFFDGNKKLAKRVKLTSKEIELFEIFDGRVLYDNGLKNINGGYSQVSIYDTDEDNGNEILICEVECGEQDMGGGESSCNKWEVNYNRNTKKFEER